MYLRKKKFILHVSCLMCLGKKNHPSCLSSKFNIFDPCPWFKYREVLASISAPSVYCAFILTLSTYSFWIAFIYLSFIFVCISHTQCLVYSKPLKNPLKVSFVNYGLTIFCVKLLCHLHIQKRQRDFRILANRTFNGSNILGQGASSMHSWHLSFLLWFFIFCVIISFPVNSDSLQ